MRMITSVIQFLMVGGAVWILYALYISRGNSGRLCLSCGRVLAVVDVVHCAECLENPAPKFPAAKAVK